MPDEPADNPFGLPPTRTLMIGVGVLAAIAITVLIIERLSRPATIQTAPCADCSEKRKNAVSRHVVDTGQPGNGSPHGVPTADDGLPSGEFLSGTDIP